MCNTGNIATFGQSTTRAMGLAVEEINAKGGVLGKQLQLIVEDDASDQQQVPNAVNKLITKDNVVVVIGEVASSNSMAGASVCQPAGVPMITPSSTNVRVTQEGDYIFRSCFTDDFQAAVMALFARRDLKAQTAVILKDIKSDYSKGLTEFFQKSFTALGGKVLGVEAYAQKDKDFRAQLTKINTLKPDVIYLPGYYEDIGNICRQARELGIKSTFIGGDGWDSPKLVELGEEAVEGCYFSNHYSKEEERPEVQTFVKAFQKKYGEAPDALAACGYDAVRIVADALQRAKSADRKALRDALAQTKDFPGVTGVITINTQRNAEKKAVVLTIKQGRQEYETTLSPEEVKQKFDRLF
jgi:branched-chain amino acid transport system substrate-binding protein